MYALTIVLFNEQQWWTAAANPWEIQILTSLAVLMFDSVFRLKCRPFTAYLHLHSLTLLDVQHVLHDNVEHLGHLYIESECTDSLLLWFIFPRSIIITFVKLISRISIGP